MRDDFEEEYDDFEEEYNIDKQLFAHLRKSDKSISNLVTSMLSQNDNIALANHQSRETSELINEYLKREHVWKQVVTLLCKRLGMSDLIQLMEHKG